MRRMRNARETYARQKMVLEDYRRKEGFVAGRRIFVE